VVPVEQTALAEAEVEYEDITSTQIDVAFEIVESPNCELVGAHAVIWTTTPWTIPVNQALAYGPEVEYVLETLKVAADGRLPLEEMSLICVGKHPSWCGGSSARSRIRRAQPFGLFVPLPRLKGADLAGTLARHPMHHLGGFYAAPRPLLPGDFVTTDSGTGLVHMAPDHGEDDFELCKANGINPVFAVMDDGRYRDDWGWLGASRTSAA
jgi:isoleucyl-tRNA synthetase